jgi:nitroimidazol reductase NimA-like FMN-containing flavoprotein (pyridoxamine 5'-phosphate oxidase superfamily)
MLGELNQDEIQHILENNSIGRIGCADGISVYIIPINYRYEQNAVLCYSLEGLKINIMRHHPSVCFEVDEIQDSQYWKCVIINGFFEEITDESELAELRPHYTEYMLRKKASLTAFPNKVGAESMPHDTRSRQVFYRIRFEKVSGRFESGFFS